MNERWNERRKERDQTWSKESRVENIDPVCGHDDFDVLSGFKAVELIEELQHGSLDFGVAAASALQARRSDRVDFIHETNIEKSTD